MNMISGRTETAEQRAAGAEMKEIAGMEAEAVEETGETAGTAAAAEVVAVEGTEEVAAVETGAGEETAEAAGAVEIAGAGDRRGREVRRDALAQKVREVPRVSQDLTVRQARWDQWGR